MSSSAPPDSPIQRLNDIPAILRALRQAAAQAMRKHKQAGVPAATWQDGAVVWIPPEDIPVDDPDVDDDPQAP